MIGSYPGITAPPEGRRLATDKAGVVCVMALDKLELALDRGLIAQEHEPAAMPGRRLARLDLRPERNAGADDAMALRLGLAAGIIARVDLADMRRVWTFVLKGSSL